MINTVIGRRGEIPPLVAISWLKLLGLLVVDHQILLLLLDSLLLGILLPLGERLSKRPRAS